MTWSRLKQTWHAVIASTHCLVSAENVERLLIKNKAGDKQIELSVIVIIKPQSACGPARRSDPGFVRDISKGAVAVVVIQNVTAIARNVKIDPSVAVVIPGGDSHPEGSSCHTGFVGHVGECPVVIVVVKSIL